MANKYLDQTGLEYFWGKIKTFFTGTATPLMNGTAAVGTSTKLAREDHVHPSDTTKVDKVSGKGLSTNDYTTTEKNKLAGIAAGAEVNVQADWSVTNTSSDAYIKNKPTIPPDVSGDIEDLYNELDTKVDKVSGKGLSTNDYTTDEKNKLAGIAAGAEVNQNAFSNVKVGSTTIAADGKTDTLELAAGTNITLTPDATNDKVTIAAATISPYTSTPAMDGTASAGSSANYSRGDHVHPTDTSRAALASPTFTGTPKAPTASAGTNTTQIATTAFVTTAVANAQVGAATFQGTVSSNSTISDSAYKKGWYWVVATAGTYVGETCEVGDMIFAIKDKGSAYAASDFSVVQSNLDLVAITNAEIDAIVA